eukprot:2339962-Alexandrium_andersonii.AAC.1
MCIRDRRAPPCLICVRQAQTYTRACDCILKHPCACMRESVYAHAREAVLACTSARTHACARVHARVLLCAHVPAVPKHSAYCVIARVRV